MVIVGAGIVGLTAALALLEAGKSVILLEARRIGRQVTGRSSAKITAQHSLIYRHLIDIAGRDIARAYADANRTAMVQIREWVERLQIDCDYEPKSAFTYTADPNRTLAMATGRQLLHDRPVRPVRVFYWNLEDPLDEIERRFVAIAKHFGVTPEQYEGRLFFESGQICRSRSPQPTGKITIDEASLARLERTIVEHGLDVVVIDPVISAHGIPENDNVAVDAVIKALAAVAEEQTAPLSSCTMRARASPAQPASSMPATPVAPPPSSTAAASFAWCSA